MKKFITSLFVIILILPVLAIENKVFANDDMVRLKCEADTIKRTKNNKLVGEVFVFALKGNALYDSDDKIIKNAEITENTIKGTVRNRHGMTLETVRFTIDRFTGAFNYYEMFTTLDGKETKKNSGICKVIKNEKLF